MAMCVSRYLAHDGAISTSDNDVQRVLQRDVDRSSIVEVEYCVSFLPLVVKCIIVGNEDVP